MRALGCKFTKHLTLAPTRGFGDAMVAPSLRALKRLYLKVHPDLFNAYPDAKEVNQKSFQALQAYLSHFQPSTHPNYEKIEYIVNFYYVPNESPGSEPVRSESVRLRAPDPHANSADRSRELSKALKLLFDACSIPFEGKLEDHSRPERLEDFVFTAERVFGGIEDGPSLAEEVSKLVNDARRIMAMRDLEQRMLDTLHAQLLFTYRLRVLFTFPLNPPFTKEQTLRQSQALLTRLQKVLLKHPHLRREVPQVVVLSAMRPLAPDPLGRLVLIADDNDSTWAESMRSYSPPDAAQQAEADELRNNSEAAAAAALGVGYFYSDFALSRSADYINALTRLAQLGAECGVVPNVQGLRVRIYSPEAVPLVAYSSDISAKTLHVPLNFEENELYNALCDAKILLAQHEVHLALSAIIADLELKVVRRFRLRSVKQGDIDRGEYRESLQRLLAGAPLVKAFLDSLALIVGVTYAVDADTGAVTIPWDFLI